MKPKILQVHNRYLRPGGEDTVLAEEFALLQQHGHCVEQLLVSNAEGVQGGAGVALTGLRSVWSPVGYRTMSEALTRFRPDIVHVHNTFPLLSPSIYWAAHTQKIPVIQTLHNYRLTCANGLLLRDSRPCEECVGRAPLPALRYRCYKDSLAATGSLVAMQTVNRAIGSYRSKVDAYITLTRFAQALMIRAGLPAGKVHMKPNFITDSLQDTDLVRNREKQIVFVGRVDQEKGVDLLVRAWLALPPTEYKLLIIGDGPEREALERSTAGNPAVEWRGHVDRPQVLREVRRSRFLVMASRWYEGFPMVLLEALCAGTPAIVPQLGAMPEIIAEGQAGLVFTGGDAAALQAALQGAFSLTEPNWLRKAETARRWYLDHYTPETNYSQLTTIYEGVMERSPLSNSGAPE